MFPLAHIYIAEKYFNKLTNEIKLGSILPDFLTLLPNFSIEDTHKLLKNSEYPDFERAWNLHVFLDKYSEETYFYRLTPRYLQQKVGKYVGHIFVETAFDYLMFENKIYFDPPKIEEKIIHSLGKHFNKDLTLIIPSIQLFVTWNKDSYTNHLANSLLYICGVHHTVLTQSQVIKLIHKCKNVIPDHNKLLNDFVNKISK
ncbi:hypothetical protein [[Eubacterium] cellulosolvens]